MRTISLMVIALIVASAPMAHSAPGHDVGRVRVRGNGFLVHITPDGSTVYTNRSNVKVSRAGRILLGKGGYRFAPEIAVPSFSPGSLRIHRDGLVSITLRTVPPMASLPRMQLGVLSGVYFEHPENLTAIGRGFFQENQASGSPIFGNFTDEQIGVLSYRRR